jgi:hypothetical protein
LEATAQASCRTRQLPNHEVSLPYQ